MKLQVEYRDSIRLKNCLKKIKNKTHRPWRVMEVCGGQTNTILRYGLSELVHPMEFVHGPGCPICVTPTGKIDMAIALAKEPNVILCSFGDMMRVPGSTEDLLGIKALGGRVEMVYSPLDAVEIAQKNQDKEVVFFAVGFETTAPINALSVLEAKRRGVTNYSLIVSQVLVPPVVEQLFADENTRVDALLAAGHVCTIMGEKQYQELVRKYQIPIVIAGFEPLDILDGLLHCLLQLENGEARLENQYARSVKTCGNQSAQKAMEEVFEVCDFSWRGLGNIAASGLRLNSHYQDFDAMKRFELRFTSVNDCEKCISGDILKGKQKPYQCPEFGKGCTPEKPLGAPMVSEEGACQAYYFHGGGHE